MARVAVIGDLEHLRGLLEARFELGEPTHLDSPQLLLLHFPRDQGEGLEACQAALLRADAPPLVLLSSQRDELTACVALSMGAVDFVRLPVGARELQLRLGALLRRLHPPRPRSDGLPESLEGMRLSRRETELLRVLAATPGRWHSREHLLALLWEGQAGPSALQSLICRLRPRLEGRVKLQTARGLGLRLCP